MIKTFLLTIALVAWTVAAPARAAQSAATDAPTYVDENQTDPAPLKLNGVEGRVRGLGGDPMPRASVSLFTDNGHALVATVMTDKDGKFRFNKVDKGLYRVVARVEGLCTANIPILVESSHPGPPSPDDHHAAQRPGSMQLRHGEIGTSCRSRCRAYKQHEVPPRTVPSTTRQRRERREAPTAWPGRRPFHRSPAAHRVCAFGHSLEVRHQCLPLQHLGIGGVHRGLLLKREAVADVHDHEHAGAVQVNFHAGDAGGEQAVANLRPDLLVVALVLGDLLGSSCRSSVRQWRGIFSWHSVGLRRSALCARSPGAAKPPTAPEQPTTHVFARPKVASATLETYRNRATVEGPRQGNGDAEHHQPNARNATSLSGGPQSASAQVAGALWRCCLLLAIPARPDPGQRSARACLPRSPLTHRATSTLPIPATMSSANFPLPALSPPLRAMATQGFAGDNGPATAAELDSPAGLAVDAAGNLYIADSHNHRIRKVDAATGVITDHCRYRRRGFLRRRRPGTAAQLDLPTALACRFLRQPLHRGHKQPPRAQNRHRHRPHHDGRGQWRGGLRRRQWPGNGGLHRLSQRPGRSTPRETSTSPTPTTGACAK